MGEARWVMWGVSLKPDPTTHPPFVPPIKGGIIFNSMFSEFICVNLCSNAEFRFHVFVETAILGIDNK